MTTTELAAAITAKQKSMGCNQDDEPNDWGRPCCDSCVCATEVRASLSLGNGVRRDQ